MMVVTKTKAMIVLLDALRIKPWEYEILGDVIQLKINQQQLSYAIVGSEADIQHIYGGTPEWEELTQYLKGIV